MVVTNYTIETKKIDGEISIAAVSDLHARPYKNAIGALKELSPDIIILPGDIMEVATDYFEERNKNGINFLKETAKIAPSYYCFGNHEIFNSHTRGKQQGIPNEELQSTYLNTISSFGVNIINDDFKIHSINNNSIYIGGVVCGRDMKGEENSPNLSFLNGFENLEGFKILLCHYPHYYEGFLKDRDLDIVCSGHAHGGQWRLFGRGIYAPHQGLFPKYTSGIHNGRHIISRGAANNTPLIPRFFNPCEILNIKIIGTR
jgi:predicted MPP superfamily phosphohydrolase